MIIERNIFRLKFGMAKEGIAIWKEIIEAAAKTPELGKPQMRLLSDISGPAYTLVLEMHINSYMDINPKNAVWTSNEKFQDLYHRFIPLCESAHREYYKIECII
jgi:hypothetical protein